jgi:SAM-dependent methyltransferase
MDSNASHQKKKWDQRYRSGSRTPEPARVLVENLHLLPATGLALDLACGVGVNALLLAEEGLRVQAWDLSEVAIEKLSAEAFARRAQVQSQVRDALADPPEADSFDVILVSHFLERKLMPDLVRALRPGGLIFYQTFTRTAVSDTGPGNPAYRLGDNELLALFSGLLIRVYREEGRLGDTRRGCRDIAMLVAEKPR